MCCDKEGNPICYSKSLALILDTPPMDSLTSHPMLCSATSPVALLASYPIV